MLPSVATDTVKTVRYAAGVGGRIFGIAAMKNLVPDATRRAALIASGNAIIASAQALNTAYFARIQFEHLDQRITVGKGKGIDRGFDAVVAISSESIRTSLADRTHQNPEYRAIFPNGTDEYTSPTIREDEQIATDLRLAIQNSNAPAKTEVIALLDEVIPVVGPAAKALSDGEKQVNELFQGEMNARKNVIDALWEQRKIVETTLGRQGKGVARFIFFDFRKAGETDSPEPATPDPTTPPKDGG
jgi:hypothetical protein